MFSGLMATVAMCRDQRVNAGKEMPPPVRFTRRLGGAERVRNSLMKGIIKPQKDSDYEEALLHGGETIRQRNTGNTTHRDEPLLPGDGENGVVAPWAPGSWVDEEVDSLIRYWDRRRLREHDVQVHSAKDLLQGVEGEPAQLALNEIRPVLHDRLELDVPVPALPTRNQVEHVRALSCPPVLSAGGACQSDGEGGEEREVGGLVPHAQEPREEVDLACDCGNGQEAGGAYYEEREYCFVGEVGVDVGSLLKDDDVAPCAFCG